MARTQTIKRLVKRGFALFNLKVTREKLNYKIISNSQLKGLHIEFIGPPGAGKTTFCDKLFGKELNDNQWNRRKLTKQFMMSQHPPWLKFLDHNEFYTQLINLKYDDLKSTPIPESYRQMSFSFVLTELALDSFVQKKVLPFGSFISDDGLGHTFTAEIIKANTMPQFEQDLNNICKRKFIYFDASVDQSIENLKQRNREREGQGDDAFHYFTEEEIRSRIAKLINNYEKLLKIIHQRGGEVLKLNYSDPFHQNSEKVIAFINNHSQKKDNLL